MKKFISIILAVVVVSMASFVAFAADTESPSDVEKLTASPLDGAVKLKWAKAKDNVAVEGYIVHYGTKPVKKKGEKYEKQVDVKNVVEHTVDDLKNGTKYYFSVIAYDSASPKNESISWAPEVSAIPSGDAGDSKDKDAPQVASAEATLKNEVKVIFSEEVVLPTEDAEDSFTLENDDTFEPLVVTEAKMDEEDGTNKTVLLATDDQLEGVKYLLTVGIDIKDKAGNPIISGTSDTALLTGSAKQKSAEDELPKDDKAPEVTKVEKLDNSHLIVSFNETVVLSIDPSENFEITVEGDKTKTLEVLGVELGKNAAGVDDASAIVTTAPQEKNSYIVKVVDLTDEAGNKITQVNNSGKFEGVPEAGDGTLEPDLIPPKDVAKFLASKVMEAKKYVVKLSWKIPTENKADVKEQKIYMSGDKGQKYNEKTTLAPNVEKYEVKDLNPGEYWFKITQKDAAGNESAGVVSKVILAETGPGILGLLAASLWLGRVASKKK